jgi:hypothetical protein
VFLHFPSLLRNFFIGQCWRREVEVKHTTLSNLEKKNYSKNISNYKQKYKISPTNGSENQTLHSMETKIPVVTGKFIQYNN